MARVICLVVFVNRIIRPLVGVQVLQYCVPLYVRDDPRGSNESGASHVSTCTESVGGRMNYERRTMTDQTRWGIPEVHLKNKINNKGIIMEDDRGELDLTKQIEDKDGLIQELRMRIRDMLIISEQHRNILGEEIGKRKALEKEVKNLKLTLSEYMSVRNK